MPIYEYYCAANHTLYSFYAPTTAYADRVPRCPDGKGLALERQVSTFSVTGGADEKAEEEVIPSGDELAALHSLEDELAESDSDEEPSAEVLGQMLEGYAEASGRRLSEPVREMLSRLEAGEEPEALQQEYAEALEGEMLEGLPRQAKATAKPIRDPELYDIRDYLEG